MCTHVKRYIVILLLFFSFFLSFIFSEIKCKHFFFYFHHFYFLAPTCMCTSEWVERAHYEWEMNDARCPNRRRTIERLYIQYIWTEHCMVIIIIIGHKVVEEECGKEQQCGDLALDPRCNNHVTIYYWCYCCFVYKILSALICGYTYSDVATNIACWLAPLRRPCRYAASIVKLIFSKRKGDHQKQLFAIK